jgi:hypothetical protein
MKFIFEKSRKLREMLIKKERIRKAFIERDTHVNGFKVKNKSKNVIEKKKEICESNALHKMLNDET